MASSRLEDALPRVSTGKARPWFVSEAELALTLLPASAARGGQARGLQSAPLQHRADSWLTSRLSGAPVPVAPQAAPPAAAAKAAPPVPARQPQAARQARPKVMRDRPPFAAAASDATDVPAVAASSRRLSFSAEVVSAAGAPTNEQPAAAPAAAAPSREARQAAGIVAWSITPPRSKQDIRKSDSTDSSNGHNPRSRANNQLRAAAPPRAGVLAFDLSAGGLEPARVDATAAAAGRGRTKSAAQHAPEPAWAPAESSSSSSSPSAGVANALGAPQPAAPGTPVRAATPEASGRAAPACNASPQATAAGASSLSLSMCQTSPGTRRRASAPGLPSSVPTALARKGRGQPTTSVTAPPVYATAGVTLAHDAVSSKARRYAAPAPPAVASGAAIGHGPVWHHDAPAPHRRTSLPAAPHYDPAALMASVRAWGSRPLGTGWFALDGSASAPAEAAPLVEEQQQQQFIDDDAQPIADATTGAGEGSDAVSSDGYCADEQPPEEEEEGGGHFEDAASEGPVEAGSEEPQILQTALGQLPQPQPVFIPCMPAMPPVLAAPPPPVVVVVPAPAPAPAKKPKAKAAKKKEAPAPELPPSSAWWIELGGDVALPPELRRKRVKRPIKPKMYPLRRRGEGRHAVLEVDAAAAADALAEEEAANGGVDLLPSASDVSSPSSSSDDSVFYGMEGDISERTGARGPGPRSGRTASRLLRRTDAGVGGTGGKARRSASAGRPGRVRSAAPPDTTNLREAASKRLAASAGATNRALASRLAVADARARGRAAALQGARTLPGTAPAASSWVRTSSVTMPMFRHKMWEAFLPSAASRRFQAVRGLLVPRDDPVVLPGDEAALAVAGVFKRQPGRRASTHSSLQSYGTEEEEEGEEADAPQQEEEGDVAPGDDGEAELRLPPRPVRVPLRPDWSWGFWRAAAEAKAKAPAAEGKAARPDFVLAPPPAPAPFTDWKLRGRPAYGPNYNGNDLLAVRQEAQEQLAGVVTDGPAGKAPAAPLPRHAVKAMAWTAGEEVPDPLTLTVTGGYHAAGGTGVRVKMGSVRGRSSGPPEPARPPRLPGAASPLPRRALQTGTAAGAPAPPAAYVVIQPQLPLQPPTLVPLAQFYPPMYPGAAYGYPGAPYYAPMMAGGAAGPDMAAAVAAATSAAAAALQSLGVGGAGMPLLGAQAPVFAPGAAAAAAAAVGPGPLPSATQGVPSAGAGGDGASASDNDAAAASAAAAPEPGAASDEDESEDDSKVGASPLYVRSLKTGRIVSSSPSGGGRARAGSGGASAPATPSRSAHPVTALRSPALASAYDSDDPHAPNAMEQRLAYRRAEKKWQRQQRAERGEGRDSSAKALASSARRGTTPPAAAKGGSASTPGRSVAFGGTVASSPSAKAAAGSPAPVAARSRRDAEESEEEAVFAKLHGQMIGTPSKKSVAAPEAVAPPSASRAAASSVMAAASSTAPGAATPSKALRGTGGGGGILPPASPVAVSAATPSKARTSASTTAPTPPSAARGPQSAGFISSLLDDDDDHFIDAARAKVLSPSKPKK